jgi:glycosyltransferase involved in cell wall biosynthesis
MEVWIFQTGEPLHSDEFKMRPMRAINLSEFLVKRKHKVIIWSSAFFHQMKIHRSKSYTSIKINPHLEIRLIPSPGYIKNISIKRIYDHIKLAANLRSALSKQEMAPDVAFIGYPPIEFASVASSWLRKNNIPYLVDVKDQWPEIFIRPFPKFLQAPAKLLFWPYYYYGRKLISHATSVCSIAPSFLEWACKFSNRRISKLDHVFPLSSILSSPKPSNNKRDLEFWKKHGVLSGTNTRFFFAGTFSSVFDFTTVRNAVLIANENKLNFQFIFCGDGENIGSIKKEFAGLDNIIFPGWVSHSQLRLLASISDAALAPYLNYSDFLMSVPNKIIDYLSLGCPVITPLKGEVGNLLNKDQIGLSYKEGNEDSLYKVLFKIHSNKKNRAKFSYNSRKLYENYFDGNKIYKKMVRHLELIGKV